jgi:ABC-type lipoprotein export system ATPase subunit
VSIIHLEGINFSFYNEKRETEFEVLKNINMNVKQGEFHLITGPSGSGKTTLLQVIGTLLHQKNGRRNIFSKDIPRNPPTELLSETRKQIGYLFQTPYLPPNLTVNEYLVLQGSLTGFDLETAEKKASDLLEKFSLEDFRKNRPIKLSGGEKQKVALAGVMVKNIKLLLLDEPTGSLDYDNRLIIWELITKMKSEEITIIAVSHDNSIAEIADITHNLDYGSLQKIK